MRLRTLLLSLLALGAVATWFVWMNQPDVPPSRVPAAASHLVEASPSISPSPTRETSPALPPASPEPAFASFDTWLTRYRQATPGERTPLLTEGLRLAAERRATLAHLIQTDPARALALALPVLARRSLPPEMLRLVEERVSGIGDISLLGVTPAPGRPVAEPVYHSATVDGREFRAYLYGRRARAHQIRGASIQGIAIDGALAISDSPLRVLEPGETAEGRPVELVCPVSGRTTPVAENAPLNLAEPVAVEVGGKIQILCHTSHVGKLAAQLIAHEQVQNAADGGPGTSGVSGRPAQTWTHGTKKILIIRVDFSDKTGTPVNPFDSQSMTEDYIVNRFNNAGGVRDFYEQNSFGKTTLSVGATVAGNSPDVTSVLRMPSTASSYATTGNNDQLHTDARNLATAAGFNLATYDRIGVVFADLGSLANSQITYGGLGNIDGPDFWINGYFTFDVVAHEIGHTYGLYHANLWQVSDGNPVSPTGTSVEYGDIFEVMGNGDLPADHFSHWNKSILQWIPDTAVTTITTGGTYRVFRFDAQGANLANALALKVVRNNTQDYWIGFRRATTNAPLDNGAYILWGYNDNQQGNLLDFGTPGTNVNDCALQVGSAFNDTAAGITLTTLAHGGTGNDEWLDVQVTFQPRIQFAASNFVADEQSGTATLTLTRTNNSTGAVSVNYATAPGIATSPADFTAKSGTVSWASGDLAPKTITVSLVADALVEGTEQFTVNLSGITGGVVVGGNSATVTIADPGAVDPQFAADFTNNTIEKLVVLPDGKIIAGGWFDLLQDTGFTEYPRGGIARYNANGTLDPTFAVDGGVTGPDGSFPRVKDIARQPDGKLIIGGVFTTVDGVARTNLARLNADGSLDTTFNPGTSANDEVIAVLLQPDGKVLVGGYFTTFNAAAKRLLVRLNADGTVDNTFAPPTFGSGSGWRVESLALQTDGKILVGGSFYFSGSPSKASLCRVLTTGAVDAAFNGIAQGAHQAGDTTTILSVEKIAVLPDATILIAGNFTAYNNTARGGIAKLTNTGALVPAFAPTSNGRIGALRVQPDGKILVGGDFTLLNGATATRLGRLTSAGANDTAFLAAGGHSVSVEDLAFQPDGRVVLGGDYGSFHGSADSGPLWRFYSGLPSLPGVIQLSAETATGVEGTTLTVTATRTGGSLGALSVGYSTVAGTATAADFTAASGSLAWTDGDSATKSITIPITSDALNDSGETFTLNLGEGLLGSALLGTTQQATITVKTAFGAWQAANFTPLELADSTISGDLADPDGDGRPNLIEFSLGSNPRLPDSSGPTSSLVTVSTSKYLALTFRRRTPALDLAYTVQNGNSLTAWGTTAVIVGSPVNNGDGTETVTYRDNIALSAAPGPRFLRVQVQRTP